VNQANQNDRASARRAEQKIVEHRPRSSLPW
jgi:hypothetical protein